MNRETRVKKLTWIPFLIIYGCALLLLSIVDINRKLFLLYAGIILVLYISAYVHGFLNGREGLKDTLDFMGLGLKQKVLENEELMHNSDRLHGILEKQNKEDSKRRRYHHF